MAWVFLLNPGKKPKRVWKPDVKKKTVRKRKRTRVRKSARRIRRNDDLAKYIGVGLKENGKRKKKVTRRSSKARHRKVVVKRKKRIVAHRKIRRTVKHVSIGAKHMAKKRHGKKAHGKHRKVAHRGHRKARKVARRSHRKVRHHRKRSHAKRIVRKAKKAVKVTVKINPPKRHRRHKAKKNAWTAHPVLHARASSLGHARRRIGIKGYKKSRGLRMFGKVGPVFPLHHNPFSKPLGLSRFGAPKHRKHSYSRKGKSMGAIMNVLRNPVNAVKGLGGGVLKPIMDKQNWIDASVIAGGSIGSTIGSAYLAAAIAKVTGKQLATSGLTGTALKLATGAIGATAIAYKSPRHAKNFLYGTVAGVMADLIKTQVLPRIPFLNTTAPVADYLQTQGVQDYLETAPGVGTYVAPSEIQTAADDDSGSEF